MFNTRIYGDAEYRGHTAERLGDKWQWKIGRELKNQPPRPPRKKSDADVADEDIAG